MKGSPTPKTSEDINNLYEAIHALPISEKAELVHRLIGDSGFSIVLENNNSSDNLAVQISMMQHWQLADLCRAIAHRMEQA